MSNILRQVTLDRISRKKDRSVSMTFLTQLEQSSEEFMELDKQLDQNGVIYFKTSGLLTDVEVKELDKSEIEVEGKSKSQRLRNVIFRYWEQNNKNNISFNDFYATEMEKIIEHYKSKLK
jgi:hypothetical protein